MTGILDKEYVAFKQQALKAWTPMPVKDLYHVLQEKMAVLKKHGYYDTWYQVLEKLPLGSFHKIVLEGDTVGCFDAIKEQPDILKKGLLKLSPWRKGPFHICGVDVDTEWRSDWKWDRLAPHLGSLAGKRVLDIGCGNGYHLWRLAGCGAQLVIGIDPYPLFVMQFFALQHFLKQPQVMLFPLGVEDLPSSFNQQFDLTLSMGVLYHRKDPQGHIKHIFDLLQPKGQAVVESLIVDGDTGLVPDGRYAQMRNVHWIPTVQELIGLMESQGFQDVQCVDVTRTSLKEQRTTEFMSSYSLGKFLDPNCADLTVEGYPAPKRAIIMAQKPI